MGIIQLVLILAAIGVIVWAINTYVPMDARIKQIMNVVVLLAVFFWLLNAFGVIGPSTTDLVVQK